MKTKKMSVLIACEFSGIVRDAFSRKGHNAISCDLFESESPGPHIIGDAIQTIESRKWDMIIAHPPCTYLANSGVRWLINNQKRYLKMIEAAEFFKKIMNADCKKICIENPIMHGYASALIGEKYSQIIHPYEHGHPEKKSTCLWLIGLPLLIESKNVKTEMMKLPKSEREKCHYQPPGENRWRIRSRTYTGIADAMANQWSE